MEIVPSLQFNHFTLRSEIEKKWGPYKRSSSSNLGLGIYLWANAIDNRRENFFDRDALVGRALLFEKVGDERIDFPLNNAIVRSERSPNLRLASTHQRDCLHAKSRC